MLHTKTITVILLTVILVSCGDKKNPESALDQKSTTEKSAAEADSSKSNVPEVIREKEPQSTQSESEPKQEETKPEAKKIVKPAQSNIKSISELWSIYKKAKAEASKAIENGNIDKIVEQLKIAGESAIQLGRDDIAAWQFNNIGHYSIEEFKKRTGYDDRIRAMATMPSGKEKSDFIMETKKLLNSEIDLLDQAKKNLERAQIIDDELEKSRRTETIERNLDFINWVMDFLG